MNNLLIVLLLAVAVAMIVLSFKAGILPPGLTGVGFIIIAILFARKQGNSIS